jgi:putative holliday junction resolvase
MRLPGGNLGATQGGNLGATLGLDVGEKRIGVALSEGGVLARPLTVLHRRTRVDDFAAIAEIVRVHQIQRVVVGLPTSTEGEIGPQARRVKRFARELARILPAPVVFVDESYTTVDALDVMATTGQSGKKRRERVDEVAAAFILQAYLDAEEAQPKDRPQSVATVERSSEGK